MFLKRVAFLLLIILTQSCETTQHPLPERSLDKAIYLFDRNQLEDAFPIFYKLSDTNPKAKAYLALYYVYGVSVEKNFNIAAELAKESYQDKDPLGYITLGYLYAQGVGVEHDYHLGERLAIEGAHLGGANELFNLGSLYGIGVFKDDAFFSNEFNFYMKAAELGHPLAQHNIANMFENGAFVTRDVDEAKLWCLKAAAQGVQQSKEALKRLR